MEDHMKISILIIIVFLLSACSGRGYGHGTHPVEQGIVDFWMNEIHTVIRTGSMDRNISTRAGDEMFRIGRSEYWRVRQEQIIGERWQR